MIYAMVYASAAISAALALVVAHTVATDSFAMVALGLVGGSFASVLVNLGTDQSQLRALFALSDPHSRRRQVVRSLLGRSGLLGILLVFMLAHTTWRHGREGLVAALYFFWVAQLGLQPNAYADYLRKQRSQQATILIERLASAICVLSAAAGFWSSAQGSPLLIGLALGGIRMVSTVAQWKFLLGVDKRSLSELSGGRGFQRASGFDASAATATLCNAITAYIPVLLLEWFHLKSDLSLYSLTLQAVSVVLLFHGVAARIAAPEIASRDCRTPDWIAYVFRAATRVFFASAALAAFVAPLTMAALINMGYGTIERTLPLAVVLFAWSAWLGFGQVITRSLILSGNGKPYALASIATAAVSLVTGSLLVEHYGALGSALAVTLPHSTMIAFCAWSLRSNNLRHE